MAKIQDPTLQGLIKDIHDQSQVRVSAATPVADIQAAFKGGETIKALEKTHPLYNTRKKRIFPFYDEDKGIDEVDRELFEGYQGAIANIAYHWGFLTNENESLSNYTHHYDELRNEIGQLVSWHPEHNYETGEIEPGFVDPYPFD